ncbi:MAG: PDZ domain-containing protein [Oscillospiraceae bacterium]|nr:PDZ domain-containing protein [Oscillospiraceae bacterium]
MKKLLRFLSYVLVAALASAATLGISAMQEKPYKLEELQRLIQEKYIGEADATLMGDAAAAAMVASIGDRWSYYISAADYQDHMDQMNNSYVGIGVTIQVTEDDSGFLILRVEQTGPAAESGILAGDKIVGVSGQSVAGMTTTEVGTLVKGEEGTTVDITVEREAEEITFTVERRKVLTVVAKGQMLEDGIGLVTIANFDARCFDETIAAIEALLEQGAEKLIFDVRNNPGGYKSELVDVLDYLLPEGPLFRSERYNGEVEVDESDADCLEIPMAVLFNASSYSAAEFFAAALEEYDAAVTVGEATTGKGYFQVTTKLSDGSAVNLSIGRYTTPNGVSLAEVGGLVPQIQVEVDDETRNAIYAGTLEPENDPQIRAAIAALRGE